MLQYVHVASTFGLCSCHLVISHARMNPNPLHAAPSVMMRKGFEPKPGSWSSNSGDKILGFLQQTLRFWWLSNSSFKTGSWVGSKLSKFRHCRFHVLNFSQSIQGLSVGNFEQFFFATIQPGSMMLSLTDVIVGRSPLQHGLCFSCDSNFLASTFHLTHSCGAELGLVYIT